MASVGKMTGAKSQSKSNNGVALPTTQTIINLFNIMNDLEQAKSNGTAPWDDEVKELTDFHVAVFRDRYPVTSGHLLFVPQYNTDTVILDCFDSAMRYGRHLVNSKQCDSFNIGINMGRSAGQTVMYPHVHLIPRRSGDCPDPTGGVRGVITWQQNYKSSSYSKPA
jgi:diadenosine tetraphosphate (Ap4A) HIT family hydrolase